MRAPPVQLLLQYAVLMIAPLLCATQNPGFNAGHGFVCYPLPPRQDELHPIPPHQPGPPNGWPGGVQTKPVTPSGPNQPCPTCQPTDEGGFNGIRSGFSTPPPVFSDGDFRKYKGQIADQFNSNNDLRTFTDSYSTIPQDQNNPTQFIATNQGTSTPRSLTSNDNLWSQAQGQTPFSQNNFDSFKDERIPFREDSTFTPSQFTNPKTSTRTQIHSSRPHSQFGGSQDSQTSSQISNSLSEEVNGVPRQGNFGSKIASTPITVQNTTPKSELIQNRFNYNNREEKTTTQTSQFKNRGLLSQRGSYSRTSYQGASTQVPSSPSSNQPSQGQYEAYKGEVKNQSTAAPPGSTQGQFNQGSTYQQGQHVSYTDVNALLQVTNSSNQRQNSQYQGKNTPYQGHYTPSTHQRPQVPEQHSYKPHSESAYSDSYSQAHHRAQGQSMGYDNKYYDGGQQQQQRSGSKRDVERVVYMQVVPSTTVGEFHYTEVGGVRVPSETPRCPGRSGLDYQRCMDAAHNTL